MDWYFHRGDNAEFHPVAVHCQNLNLLPLPMTIVSSRLRLRTNMFHPSLTVNS
jgi:hypothetical protein